MIQEEWRDIVGFEGSYQVSNLGNVRSLSRTVDRCGHSVQLKFKQRKLSIHKSSGYHRISLRKNSKTIFRYVHNLVLEAFVSNRPNNQDADHINKIRTDNRLVNLRWLPLVFNRSSVLNLNGNSNINYFKRTGHHRHGEYATVKKLTNKDVIMIRKMISQRIPNVVIARQFKVTPDNISKIKRNLTWTHLIQ